MFLKLSFFRFCFCLSLDLITIFINMFYCRVFLSLGVYLDLRIITSRVFYQIAFVFVRQSFHLYVFVYRDPNYT